MSYSPPAGTQRIQVQFKNLLEYRWARISLCAARAGQQSGLGEGCEFQYCSEIMCDSQGQIKQVTYPGQLQSSPFPLTVILMRLTVVKYPCASVVSSVVTANILVNVSRSYNSHRRWTWVGGVRVMHISGWYFRCGL